MNIQIHLFLAKIFSRLAHSTIILFILGALAACGGGDSVAASSGTSSPVVAVDNTNNSNSLPRPSELLDLSHVTLSLPISSGNGGVQTLSPTQLAPSIEAPRGYESEYLMTVSTSDGPAVQLWCPVNGVLASSSSDSPRTEFRHQVVAGSNDKWLPTDLPARVMTTEFAVLQLPPTKQSVIVGQVHGFRITGTNGALINAAPLLLAYFELSKAGDYVLNLKLRDNPDPAQLGIYSSSTIARTPQLGRWQLLRIQADGDALIVNGQRLILDTRWHNVGLYFKSGLYLDETGIDPSKGAKLLLRQLTFN